MSYFPIYLHIWLFIRANYYTNILIPKTFKENKRKGCIFTYTWAFWDFEEGMHKHILRLSSKHEKSISHTLSVRMAVSCLEPFTLTSQTLTFSSPSVFLTLPSSLFLTLTLSLTCSIRGASKIDIDCWAKEEIWPWKVRESHLTNYPALRCPAWHPCLSPPRLTEVLLLSPHAHKAIHAKCLCCRNCTSQLSISVSPALQVNCLSDSAVMNIWFEKS